MAMIADYLANPQAFGANPGPWAGGYVAPMPGAQSDQPQGGGGGGFWEGFNRFFESPQFNAAAQALDYYTLLGMQQPQIYSGGAMHGAGAPLPNTGEMTLRGLIASIIGGR